MWGTSSEDDNVTWGNSGEETPLFDDPNAEPVTFDISIYDDLFGTSVIETAPLATATTTTTTTITTTLGGLLSGGGL